MASLLDKGIYGLVELTGDESFAAIIHLASCPALHRAARPANRPGSQRSRRLPGVLLFLALRLIPARCDPRRFAARSELEAALQALTSGISGLAPATATRLLGDR